MKKYATLVSALVFSIAVPVLAGPAAGPLRVLSSNPRYFSDGSGKAVYLTGSHTWCNFATDQGKDSPPAGFDFDAYLEFLVAHNHNFFRGWVWKNLVRGNNVLFMDPYLTKWTTRNNPVGTNHQDPAFGTSPDPYWETLRNAMGRVRKYADKVNLAAMTPQNTLASTAYCLAHPGHEYVVYQPKSNSAFTVRLEAGAYHYEWYNPSTDAVASSGEFTASAGEKTFSAPFSGDAVLYVAVRGT